MTLSFRERNRFGLVKSHENVLRFLYEQPKMQAESIRIGKVDYPDAKFPGTRVSFAISSLCGKGFVRRVTRGFYELTPSGKRLVEEMMDDNLSGVKEKH